MIKFLITTVDFGNDNEINFQDHETGINEEGTNADFIERIASLIFKYKDHDEVRVKYLLLEKRLNRSWSGYALKSLRFPKEEVMYEIERDLERIVNHHR